LLVCFFSSEISNYVDFSLKEISDHFYPHMCDERPSMQARTELLLFSHKFFFSELLHSMHSQCFYNTRLNPILIETIAVMRVLPEEIESATENQIFKSGSISEVRECFPPLMS
jgi:hypothetical protein